MPARSFVLFTLGPVQGFIKAARSVRDLWSGSYLLSYLTFRAMQAVADEAGPDAIVFPDYARLPLAEWKPGTRADDAVLEPCIPNRFLAEVEGDEAAGRALADAAEKACRGAWGEIAEAVRRFLYRQHGHPSFAPDDTRENLWHQQVDTFFEVYTAVLPHDGYDPHLLAALLGAATGNAWADRHQVAQKLLAAVKTRRHFPVYAPWFADGRVPQKDTLLGTLEHVGPGDRGAANGFWETAAARWHSQGSKVTRRERLCAVSLVKRFAWAHHFSGHFGLDPRELRYADSATVAAARWLAAGTALRPDAVRREHRGWSGQWLHWPDKTPPNDDIDEDDIPDNVFAAIRDKKAKQGKPPAYYAVFVFDGDRMGDRFNAATDAASYRAISQALGTFALRVIEPIVAEHSGELIYAGGDDALCVLPTETALACARRVNDAFRANWAKLLPGQEPATISGGLVVAHYKEDLRFVMDEARRAEKAAKDAGRDALQVTVCRRSGEHSSALVPWGFVDTVAGWVDGFLTGASDRWAYKLRGDLPTIGEDREMFGLELGRQLNRAEDATRRHFPARDVRAAFETHKGTAHDFVVLLQTASFLARGRDA